LTRLIRLRPYIFHIALYDIAFLGTVFVGLNFALLLWFTKSINRAANRFLGLALVVTVLWMARILCGDIRLYAYMPHWNWLPLQFSLAFGPLIYFYVLKLTRPEYKFRQKDILHFSPLLLELAAHALEVNADSYDALFFQQLNLVLHVLAFVSVGSYLYLSIRLIDRFYRRQNFTGGDRYRHHWRWLRNLLAGFGLLWLLWIPCVAVAYFYYHHQLAVQAYYPLYLLLAAVVIWMAAAAHLSAAAGPPSETPSFLKRLLPAELKQKGTWL
jgi:putative ABC transport system permease protein